MNKSLGQVGYESYCLSTNWRSLVTNANLPAWADTKEEIRIAWETAAQSVVEYHMGTLSEMAGTLTPQIIKGEYQLSQVVNCPLSSTGQAKIIGHDPFPNKHHSPWEYMLKDSNDETFKVLKSQLDGWNA